MTDPALDGKRAVIVPVSELLFLQHDASQGEEDAQAVMTVAVDLVQRVNNATHDRPATCDGCLQRICRGDHHYGIGAVLPAVGRPMPAIGFLICSSCSWIIEQQDAAAARAVRQHWQDDGAERVLASEGGRA